MKCKKSVIHLYASSLQSYPQQYVYLAEERQNGAKYFGLGNKEIDFLKPV